MNPYDIMKCSFITTYKDSHHIADRVLFPRLYFKSKFRVNYLYNPVLYQITRE